MSEFRVIPSVDQLRRRPSVAALESVYGHGAVVDALRAETEAIRVAVGAGAAAPRRPMSPRCHRDPRPGAAAATIAPSLKCVLTRPASSSTPTWAERRFAAVAIERIRALADGYTNLEYDVATGSRGARDVHAERLLCRLTGAEPAVSSTTARRRRCWCSRRWPEDVKSGLAERVGRDRRRVPGSRRDGAVGRTAAGDRNDEPNAHR